MNLYIELLIVNENKNHKKSPRAAPPVFSLIVINNNVI